MSDVISNITTQQNSIAQTATTAAKDMGKDQFLKLLTEQLKAQNPLKPIDNSQFASQLAQFSQLEQLSDIKKILQDQATSNSAIANSITNSSLPGMIGKNASVKSYVIQYSGENSVPIGYNLPDTFTSGKLTIYNEAGQIVKTVDLASSSLSKGDHKYSWDGTDDKGNTVSTGKYYMQVGYKNSDGSESYAQTSIFGRISGIRFRSDGSVLVVNGQEYSLQDITDISEN